MITCNIFVLYTIIVWSTDKEDTTKKSLDSHTSFEDYKNDVGKLKKIAEQVAFTIIYQAIRYNRLEEYKKVIL